MIALNETRKPAVWCPGLTGDMDLTRGLRGYWPLWEGAGERVTNVAAAVGDGAFADQYQGYPTWERSAPGHVARLCTVSDGPSYHEKVRIDFGASAWLSPVEAITVILRIRPFQNRNYPCFGRWAIPQSASTSAWLLAINNNQCRWLVHLAGTAREINVAFSDWGNWQFVAGTYDGRNMRLYLNGDLVAGPTAYSGPIDQGLASSVYVGALVGYPGVTFNAQTAELGLWGRALQPAQIEWLYRHPFGLCRQAGEERPTPLTGSIAGPYRAAAGNVWLGGAEAGGQHLTGTGAGIALVDGQQAGRIHG
jgi:hypothetical protein